MMPDKAQEIKGSIMHKHIQRLIRTTTRMLLLILFVAGFVLSVFPWGRAVMRSTLLLPAFVTASEPAPLIFSGEPIHHISLTIPSSSGTVFLDVYAPTTPTPLIPNTRGGILIIPGAGDNRQVPQLINLSQSLARTGLIVMDITTSTMINYDLSLQDTDSVVRAFNTLAHYPGMAGNHIGIIAFSAGVPMASFGAADPRIRDKVAYLAVFGGYFNTESVLRAFGRRALEIDGKTEHWQPTAVPLLVLTNVMTKTLSPTERSLIMQALAPGGTPLTLSEQAQLSPAAQATYQLLTGDAPIKVDTNIATLPASIHVQLDELSPSRVISQIRAPIFLLHDRHDSSIPVTESRAFASALARIHHPYDYVEFNIFDHVEVRSHLDTGQILGDGSHLFGILTKVLLANA